MDRIRNITGSLSFHLFNGSNGAQPLASIGSGAFATVNKNVSVAATTPLTTDPGESYGLSFSADREIETGPDVAPSHFSKRLWRRVS